VAFLGVGVRPEAVLERIGVWQKRILFTLF